MSGGRVGDKMQNDLISRSALLESFRKCYCGHLGMENSDGMLTFRSICRIINGQPIAYDREKVLDDVDDFEIRCCDCQESCNTEGCLIERIKNVIRNGGKE